MVFIQNKIAECLYQGATIAIEDRTFASPEEIDHDISPELLANRLMLTVGISMAAYIAYIANKKMAKQFPSNTYFHNVYNCPANMFKIISYCGFGIFLTASTWFLYQGLKDGCWNGKSIHHWKY